MTLKVFIRRFARTTGQSGMTPTRAHRARRWLSALAGVVIALLLVELVMRQIYRYPLALDPAFGQRIAKGSTVRWRIEGNGVSHWDERGLRRSSHEDVPGAPILAVGDSFTEALMLDDDEVYSDVVEALLRRAGHRLSVRNAGKSMLSVADYIFHAPMYLREYSPRWFIVQVRDDDFNANAWQADPGTAYFVRDDDTLTVSGPEVRAPRGIAKYLFDARQTSSTLGYGVARFREFMRESEQEPPLFRAASHRPADVSERDDYPVEPELAMLVAALGGRLTLLYFPTFDPRQIDAPTHTEQRVQTYCGAHEISFVNVRSSWPEFAARHEAPYGFSNTRWNTGHMNAAGHAAAAHLLALELERLIARAVF